jgi:hypothetical protein
VSIKYMAATCYTVISAGVAVFQIALAVGAPWGIYAMGGAFPGQFPPAMRIAAVVQAALMMLMSAVVLSRAGVALHVWSQASRWFVWLIVVIGAASLAMNIATPSTEERMIWAPVAFLLLVCSVIVATSKTPE